MAATEYAIAFSGGVISFLSPCVLPVVPAYLSVTTGLSLSEIATGGRRSRLVAARGGLCERKIGKWLEPGRGNQDASTG